MMAGKLPPYVQPSTAAIERIKGKHLKIYTSQYNIGLKIVEEFIKRGALDLNQPLSAINLIIVGPIFKDLREQTKRDIVAWKSSNWVRFLSCDVINSSSLSPEEDITGKEKEFFTGFKEDKDALHVVVHDEAHWGIMQKGRINKFFQRLRKAQDQLNRRLLILCVSATIYFLKSIELFKAEDDCRVDWDMLRKSNDLRFATPSYLAWDKLTIEVDMEIGKCKNNSEASVAVVNEYISAMNTVIEHQSNKSRARRVVDALMQGVPCVAIVRLDSKPDAEKLQNAFLKFRQNDPNIYVIALHGSHEPLKKQLSHQHYVNSDKVENLNQLHGVSCMVIVVDKVRMGERIPQTTKYFDVRCCYLKKRIASKATCVQDVGRCAGHNKEPATVFIGIDPRLKGSYTQLDRSLTSSDKPKRGHPEYDKDGGVYNALKQRIVILDAEPQIGKTGAIISMVDILTGLLSSTVTATDATAMIILPSQSNQANPAHDGQDVVMQEMNQFDEESQLQKLTKEYSKLANECTFEQFRSKFQGLKWKEYHDIYEAAKKKRTDMKFIDEKIFCLLDSLETQSDEGLKVADCGCGRRGLYSFLCDHKKWERKISIYGFDIDESIRKLEEQNKSEVVKFHACVGDMGDETHKNQYDVVVYALSLFENDITRHIGWAYENLRNRGRLIIYDVISRFPSDFVERMKLFGFENMPCPGDCFVFKYYEFYKRYPVIAGPHERIMLSPYWDMEEH